MHHLIFYGFYMYKMDCGDLRSLSRSHLQSHVTFFFEKIASLPTKRTSLEGEGKGGVNCWFLEVQ